MKQALSLKTTPVSELRVTAIIYSYVEQDATGQDNDGRPFTVHEQEIIDPATHEAAAFEPFAFRCDCCGSPRLRYACSVVHTPTMQGYHIGRDCAEAITRAQGLNVEGLSVKLNERAAVRGRRAAWVAAHPQHADLIAWAGSDDAHSIARDIYGKLGRYGSISDKQVELLQKLRSTADEPRQVDPAPTAPAPDGENVEVELELLGTKVQPGFRGSTVVKALCRVVETNAKVWLTNPVPPPRCKRYAAPVKGERFVVKAHFARSERDQFFAFAKRPRLVRFTKETAAVS